MKFATTALCLSLLAVQALAADRERALKSTVVSTQGAIKIEEEVRKYYTHLIKEDEDVKQMQEQLTAKVRESAGGLFVLGDPCVVKWYPNAETRSNDNGDTERGPYLVFQTAGRFRTKDSEELMGLISKFRVDYKEMTLKIEFLGFRQMTLAPVATKK